MTKPDEAVGVGVAVGDDDDDGHHHNRHHHHHRHPHHHQPQPQHQQQHYEQHHVISCYDHFLLSLSLCYQCYGLVIITNAITVAIITNLNLNTTHNTVTIINSITDQ